MTDRRKHSPGSGVGSLWNCCVNMRLLQLSGCEVVKLREQIGAHCREYPAKSRVGAGPSQLNAGHQLLIWSPCDHEERHLQTTNWTSETMHVTLSYSHVHAPVSPQYTTMYKLPHITYTAH